jgi:hypothetical protein
LVLVFERERDVRELEKLFRRDDSERSFLTPVLSRLCVLADAGVKGGREFCSLRTLLYNANAGGLPDVEAEGVRRLGLCEGGGDHRLFSIGVVGCEESGPPPGVGGLAYGPGEGGGDARGAGIDVPAVKDISTGVRER